MERARPQIENPLTWYAALEKLPGALGDFRFGGLVERIWLGVDKRGIIAESAKASRRIE